MGVRNGKKTSLYLGTNHHQNARSRDQGKIVKEASKLLEINEQTYYRWRREYWGMDITQAKKLREIEKENTRLNKTGC